MDKQGLLKCARYSAAPNFFGYCGPDKNPTLVGHLKDGRGDIEVKHILNGFETLFPYLKLISHVNKIIDPYDRNVVEAYWLGNSLLNKVTVKDYQSFIKELLNLDRKIDKTNFAKINLKVSKVHFLPQHSFHVFNIFKRTGHDPSLQTLETMDDCRIGWGKIARIYNSEFRIQNKNLKVGTVEKILVETLPLNIKDGRLLLGKPVLKTIESDYKGSQLVKGLKAGEWVSFHWGKVCEVLEQTQLNNLKFYTQKSIDFFNADL